MFEKVDGDEVSRVNVKFNRFVSVWIKFQALSVAEAFEIRQKIRSFPQVLDLVNDRRFLDCSAFLKKLVRIANTDGLNAAEELLYQTISRRRSLMERNSDEQPSRGHYARPYLPRSKAA